MTVRKIGKRIRARHSLLPLYELGAYNVPGFCLTHGISRSTFYVLLQAGKGPRIMKCGTRTLISVEAAQAWRRARERAAVTLRQRRGGTVQRRDSRKPRRRSRRRVG